MRLLVPGEEYRLEKGEVALINSDILHYAIGDPFCELYSVVFSHGLISGGNATAFYSKYICPLLAFPGFTVWRTDSFNRTIGDTPVQYLLKHRLLRSAAMLHSMPSASIAEISAKCGFDHPSYYTKQFRRFYQCAPRDYRSQHN